MYMYIHTRKQVGTRRASIALTFWTYLTTISSPLPVASVVVDVADTGPGGGTLRKFLFSSIPRRSDEGDANSSDVTRQSRRVRVRVRVRSTHPSSWAARRRARTRPVRAIARHTLAHRGTATPFARESALPTITRDYPRYTTGQADGADHARHYAQLTEECGREHWRRRPMASARRRETARRPVADAALLKSRVGRGAKAPAGIP